MSMIWSKAKKAKALVDAGQDLVDPEHKMGDWGSGVDRVAGTVEDEAKNSWKAVEKGFAKLAQLGVGSSLGGIVSPMSALAPMRTPGVAISARKAAGVGRFSGMASANSLKPPGPAASKAVVNPNRGVASAMRSGH